MTHTRTTTDVVLRSYPARFDYAPARSLPDFTGGRQWRVTGHWFHSETVSRRRMWTVRRDLINENTGAANDWTATLRTRYPGIVADAHRIDRHGRRQSPDALGAVLLRTHGSDAVLIVLEEYTRR